MNTIRNCCLLLLMLTTLSVMSNAQDAKMSDILSVRLSDSGPLLTDNEVRGYYFVYETESTNKDNNAYEMRIHDVNLNLLKKKIVSVPKSYMLMSLMYNGTSLAVKFFDTKEKMYVFKGYSLTGEPLFTTKSSEVKNAEAQKAAIAGEEYPSFFSITNTGYMNYMLTKDKGEKYGYEINYMSDKAGQQGWKYSSTGDEIQIAMNLAADSSMAYFNIMKREALLSTKTDIHIAGFDTKTGKRVFEVPLVKDKFKYNAFSSFIRPNGNLQLFGRFFGEKDNVLTDKGDGLAFIEIDPTGKIIKTTHLTANDKRLLNSGLISSDAKEDKSNYFFFHDFVQMADGRTLGVAESYSQKVNALGMLTTAAGYGGATTNLVIEDLYVFEFDPSFELSKVTRYEKNKSTFPIPGIPIASPILYSYYVKERGGFDYRFYQQNVDQTDAAIYYLDYERRQGEANNTVLGAVFVSPTGSTTDKFDLNPKSTTTRVFQGPFGSVMMLDYFRKEKTLDVKTVKLNY
jgi:hypothetical protein